MNCYQKILQKNVYRTCAGNCDEIASPRLGFAMTRTSDKELAASLGLSWREALRLAAILVFVITSVAK